eukprot:12416574-Karenia_brevis.AAC.1
MAQWRNYILNNPRAFRTQVSKYCKTAFANLCIHWARTKSLHDLGNSYTCVDCYASFPTKQALAVHAYKKHGLKCLARRYAPSTTCLVCMTEFWTRPRIINHLMYRSRICLQNLLSNPPLLTQREADVLDQQELESNRKLYAQSRKPAFADLPSLRVPGPLMRLTVLPPQPSSHHLLGKGRNYNT